MDSNHKRSGDSMARLIDGLCDDFESDWLAGKHPRIEDFVSRVDDTVKPKLFEELLIAELKLQQGSDAAVVDDYTKRFPAHKTLIRNAIKQTTETSEHDSACCEISAASVVRQPRTLQTRCPHCHESIEIAVDAELERLDCSACGNRFSLANERPANGTAVSQIAQFELIKRLGIGGFGVVWKARDTQLNRIVAVKVPRVGQLEPSEFEHFFREARASAHLQHPNIARVFEVGRDGDSIYIVSDFIEGQTLSDWLNTQSISAREAAELCKKIAEALHHAHECGVIHRDLKPQNVMLDERLNPSLLDFGLARREADEVTVTQDGHVLGTPAYMSPEQARGEGHLADRRTDVYSLGAMLFQLLTGELPFRGDLRRILQQVQHEEPPSLRKLNSTVPKDLETICLKCLEKSPARRYESASDLAADLIRFLEGKAINARPVSRPERVFKWMKRRPTISTLLVSCSLLICVLIGGGLWYNSQLRSEVKRSARLYRAGIDQLRWELRHLTVEIGKLQGGSSVQASLVEKHLQYLDRIGPDAIGDPLLEVDVADGYARLAAVQGDPAVINLGRSQDALVSYKKSLAIWERLIQTHPNDEKFMFNHASILAGIGSIHHAQGDTKQAKKYCVQALGQIEQFEKRQGVSGAGLLLLSTLKFRLADLVRNEGDQQQAEALLDESMKLAMSAEVEPPLKGERQTQIAIIGIRMGSWTLQSARSGSNPLQLMRKAKTQFQEAIQLLDENPTFNRISSVSRMSTAEALLQYGDLIFDLEGPKNALPFHQRALEIHRTHQQLDPNSSTLNRELSRSLNKVGNDWLEMEEVAKATSFFRQSVEISKQLVLDEPEVVEHKRDLWVDQYDFGTALMHAGEFDEAETVFVGAEKIAKQLANQFQGEQDLVRVADSCERLGTLATLRGNHANAGKAEFYQTAVKWLNQCESTFVEIEKIAKLNRTKREKRAAVLRMIKQIESFLQ